MVLLSRASECDDIVPMNLDSFHAVALAIASAVFPTDTRGVGAYRGLLPDDVYARAALAIAERRPGQALILTGFPVGGICETDGPPGAMAVGQALKKLGWEIAIVADKTTGPVLSALLGELGPVETVYGSHKDTRAACEALGQQYSADLVIAVERPGITADSRLMNMRGGDITRISAPLDCLMRAPLTVAVGDGGNEIGMGAIAPYLDAHDVVPGVSVTRATHLLLSEVSNWGAYGLVAMLDLVSAIDTLPNGNTDADWIKRLVDAGAVDGLSGENVATVDGHSLRATAKLLAQLRGLSRARRSQAKSG